MSLFVLAFVESISKKKIAIFSNSFPAQQKLFVIIWDLGRISDHSQFAYFPNLQNFSKFQKYPNKPNFPNFLKDGKRPIFKFWG